MATVDQYSAPTAEQMRQRQLSAKQLGLDLNLYQQFALNPNAFKQQNAKYFNKDTNTWAIPDVTPGGLIGAPRGPNGTVLAAGSTPTNPLDLAATKSSAVTPGSVTLLPPNSNFLPPYLQPKTAAQPIAQTTQPATKIAASGGIKSPIGVPYYLRGAKRKAGMISYG